MAPRSILPKQDDLWLIKSLFPGIKWSEVPVKYGMPWFLEKSFASAAALPLNNFSKKLKIVYRDNYGSATMLKTLYHEAVHIQQYIDLNKKFPLGIGYFNVFMMHYLGWTVALFVKGIFIQKLKIKAASAYAYSENPLEKEAYNKEKIFFQKVILKNIPKDSRLLLHENPEIINKKSDYRGFPPILAFITAIILCLLIFIIKPILDLFALIFSKIQSKFKKHKNNVNK